jgi:hypothetical protein
MRSAFRRGVELLSEPESDPVRGQEQTVESPRRSVSEHLEGVSGVPKNVTELKPIIDKLIDKVIMIHI